MVAADGTTHDQVVVAKVASEGACGDADGNGSITVSDGVQIMRAAAELSSVCTVTTCDVDANGAIAVTDAVQVLRAAAGLPLVGDCGG
jgi:hypothetical protein